jgi:hypothetical protein
MLKKQRPRLDEQYRQDNSTNYRASKAPWHCLGAFLGIGAKQIKESRAVKGNKNI